MDLKGLDHSNRWPLGYNPKAHKLSYYIIYISYYLFLLAWTLPGSETSSVENATQAKAIEISSVAIFSFEATETKYDLLQRELSRYFVMIFGVHGLDAQGVRQEKVCEQKDKDTKVSLLTNGWSTRLYQI